MTFKVVLIIAFTLVSFLIFQKPVHAQTSCTNNPTSTTTDTTTVEISQTGTYTIWSQLLAPSVGNSSYYLKIDGGCAIDVGDGSTIPANTWTWVNYQNGNTATPITIYLTAGTHTVELIQNANGVGVGRILFDQDSSCVPTGMGDNCAVIPTSAPIATIQPTALPTAIPIPTTPPAQTVTVGYSSYNGTYVTGRNNQISATQVTTGATGGTLQSISIYVGNVANAPYNHIQMGIYASNGSNAPGSLLSLSRKVTLTANHWNTIPLTSITLNPNTPYWLGFNLDGAATQVGLYSSTTGLSIVKKASFGKWPSPLGTTTATLVQTNAIYMTYVTNAPTLSATTPPSSSSQTYTSGYTAFNGSFDSGNNNMMSSTQITTGANSGPLQSISVYMGGVNASPNNHMQVGIYADNGSNAPGQLLGTSNIMVISPNSWNTVPLSGVNILPTTKYWLVFNLDGYNTQFGWYSTTTGLSKWKNSTTFGTWLNPFGTTDYAQTEEYAIYMTY